MKKEKTIRTYQRKTKSGKITTVKSHTAKYDAAAEVAKKAARKKGAGGELQAKITKMPDPKLELQQYLDELKKSRSGASSDTTKTTKPAPKKKLKNRRRILRRKRGEKGELPLKDRRKFF